MKKRLLIVDDSRFIYEEMKQMLMDSDYEIAEYSKTGEESIVKLENCTVDVVTMDVILPGMSGMEAAEIILEKWPDLKVIMVSSLAYDETIQQAERIGACDFIFKPFTKEELIKSLDKCFGSETQEDQEPDTEEGDAKEPDAEESDAKEPVES